MTDNAIHANCLGHSPSGTCIPVGSMTTTELKERQGHWLACHKQQAEARRRRVAEEEERETSTRQVACVPARDAAIAAERAARSATISAVVLAAVSIVALALAVVVLTHG